MAQDKFHQPDEAAMERLLKEYRWQPAGIILHLAWREGLTRGEISELTWNQVDFDAGLLRLPDREVPLEAGTADVLRQWKMRCSRFSEYVAVTDRLRKRLVPQSMTALARNALDSAGQRSVRLLDLRYDFIRRQFALHEWPYVLRIAGISLSTYRAGLHALVQGPPPDAMETPDDVGEDFKLWKILQAERATPAGIALWLSSQMGLQSGEIARLTWADVDLDGGTVRLPDREIPLTAGVANVLRDEKNRRRPEDDPHVILTPRSRRPMDAARLTTVVRGALIRGGIENRTMQDFRKDTEWESQREKLRAFVKERGGITRKEAVELLGVTMSQAYGRLTRMAEDGELVLLGSRYYPAGTVVAPQDREDAVLRYIAEHGPAYRREISEKLGMCRINTTKLLNRMIEEGKLTVKPGTWRYDLAEKLQSDFLETS